MHPAKGLHPNWNQQLILKEPEEKKQSIETKN
jgi:hypothetical protein